MGNTDKKTGRKKLAKRKKEAKKMDESGEWRAMLGRVLDRQEDHGEQIAQVLARQDAHARQLCRVESRADEAWRWSSQHRTGVAVIMMVGGAALTMMAIAKGWLFGR